MVGATDIGRRRKSNQDSIYFDEVQGLAAIADGIGGRKGGDIASNLAVESVREIFLNSDQIRHEEVPNFMISIVDQVNQNIIEFGKRSPEFEGMGTTLECLMFVGDRLYISHVGDSRTYLFQDDHFFQITIDHNIKNFLERGWLQDLPKEQMIKESALVRAIGLANRCEADIYEMKLVPGQMFLACTDGLTAMLDDKSILKILSQGRDSLAELPRRLITAANEAGGKDNITVLVAKVGE